MEGRVNLVVSMAMTKLLILQQRSEHGQANATSIGHRSRCGLE
jgi:hypothetical protein